MIYSETDIANIALTRCGHNQITALTNNVKGADLCRLHYPICRDAVLRAHPWNFAIRRQALSALSDAPSFEYDYQFPLPTDPWCLKVIRTSWEADGFTDIPYRIEGRYLLTNEDSCSIEYIARVTDVTQFDELFVDTLASRLAADLATPLAQNATLADAMMKVYQMKLVEARSIDAQEGTPREVVTTDAWLAARL